MARKDLLGPAGGEEEELNQREDRVSKRSSLSLGPNDGLSPEGPAGKPG
ncbi:MAG: hypothetical protein WA705_02295 [Candidatus Ozemobacteraceae bacterium]